MNLVDTLDKASGFFFFSGFVLSKMQYIPVPLMSLILKFSSLASWAIAYSLWLLANVFRPDQKKKIERWYGFAQIKEQFFFSSFLGLSATLLSIAAVFIPSLFPIVTWLFLFGNTLWCIGEYHKLNNPPNDRSFSYTRQEQYYFYALTSTLISATTAISTTLILIYPPITVAITIFTLLVNVGMGIFSSEYWLIATFGNHKPTPFLNSYSQINEALGLGDSIELSDFTKQNCNNSTFKQEQPLKSAPIVEPEDLEVGYSLSPFPNL